MILFLSVKETHHFLTNVMGFLTKPNVDFHSVYFYNYSWRDYGEASLAHLLDMVKVLSFAVTQGEQNSLVL